MEISNQLMNQLSQTKAHEAYSDVKAKNNKERQSDLLDNSLGNESRENQKNAAKAKHDDGYAAAPPPPPANPYTTLV